MGRIGRPAFCAALAWFLLAAPAAAASRVIVLTADDEARYRAAFAAADARDRTGVAVALAAVEDAILLDAARQRLVRHPPPAPRARPVPGAVRKPPTDAARIEAAHAAFAAARFAEAEDLARASLDGPRAGQARWLLGLMAMRVGEPARAVAEFEAAAHWPHWDSWGRSGVHYWAARARLAAGEFRGVFEHLDAAAAWPATFYGQLAEAHLGRQSPLVTPAPELDQALAETIMAAWPEARRAAAFAQIDRLSDVEAELARLHGRLRPADDAAFLALARALKAPNAQLRAAEHGGPAVAAGFCPIASFTPDAGYTLDRALVMAVTRQESRFVPVAVSRSNARGLMQLLPTTAADVAPGAPFVREPHRLHDPGLNLRLGQDYIAWLSPQMRPTGDLLQVFAAYNGGPGWWGRWRDSFPHGGDVLLLMEAIPRAETRDYVARVLAHMAVCRKRMGQEPLELERLAQGRAPVYQPLDGLRS